MTEEEEVRELCDVIYGWPLMLSKVVTPFFNIIFTDSHRVQQPLPASSCRPLCSDLRGQASSGLELASASRTSTHRRDDAEAGTEATGHGMDFEGCKSQTSFNHCNLDWNRWLFVLVIQTKQEEHSGDLSTELVC